MANRLAKSTQSISANTTLTQTNTETLHATTNITISTSSLYTAVFTAPNTTDTAQGIGLHIVAAGTGGSLDVFLQEYNGAVWADCALATASIATTSLTINNWNYFQLAVPYTFTTTTAGYYRWRIVNTGATGTTTGAADSGGSNLHYYSWDSRTGALAATDNLFCSTQNAGAPKTITLDGTVTLGSGTTTVLVAVRQIGNALVSWAGGFFKLDEAANVAYTIKGNWWFGNGGGITGGDSTTDYTKIASLSFDQNGTTCNYGIGIFIGSTYKLYGAKKSSTTLWKGKLSSGVGTAASPAIIDTAVNWSVGNRVMIGPTTNDAANYNQTEYRYIITKNSATSYVWSSTLGGLENALTNTHDTNAWVVNIERDILITTTNTAQAHYLINYNSTAGSVVYNWVRHNTVGYSGKSFVGGIYLSFAAGKCESNYSIVTNQLFNGFITRASSTAETYAGLVVCDGGALGTISGSFYASSASKKTFVDCFAVDGERSGLWLESSNSLQFTRFYMLGCNQDNGSDAGTTYFSGAYNIRFDDCESHCNRSYGLSVGSSAMTFNNYLSGTKGYNTVADILCSTNNYTKIIFNNSNFGSPAFITNYLNLADGSEVAFDTLNDTVNNHFWYDNRGIGRSTGAGLTDTTVRTVGTLNVGLCPESADGKIWEFQVLARPATYVQVGGFIFENAAFVADASATVVVELFLPGSLVADDTQTMTKTVTASSNDAVFAVSSYYSGTINRYATIRVTASTVTASACAYVADVLNGTNNITNLLTWKDGKPSAIMFEQLGDAQAGWNVLTSTNTVVGTMGHMLATMRTLTAQAAGGGTTYITFPASASAQDNKYREQLVMIVSGPGAEETAYIAYYDGVTKRAYMNKAWITTPTSTSVFAIIPFSGLIMSASGKCPLSGGSNYIYLDSFTPSIDNCFVDSTVSIVNGTGAGQSGLITAFDGFSKRADVNVTWSVFPDNTSIYEITPGGNTVTGSFTAAAKVEMKVAILAEQLLRGGTYDVNDSLAMRMIDTDLKTDAIEVEAKNFLVRPD